MAAFIETQRLLLRELIESDAQGMYELDATPEVHRYLGNRPITHLQQAADIIAHVRRQYHQNGIGRWAVIEKSTGEFVGWAGLKYEKNTREDAYYYDLGYRLKQKYWGKGMATEAAIAALHYGFETMDLREICAAAHIENIASNKILNKIGFQLTDTFILDDEMHNWYTQVKSATFVSKYAPGT